MHKTLLYSLLILCSSSLSCLGQKTFKDTHQLLWVKGLSTSESDMGFNYNTRIQISGEFPVLDKQINSSQYSYIFYVLKSTKEGEKLFSMYDGGALHSFYTDVIKSNMEAKVDLAYLAKGAIVNFNFSNTNFQTNKSKGIFYLENGYDKSTTALYEVLVCKDCADPLVRDQIETYLALKYGITLSNKEKYKSSKGIQIWDAQYNSSFNHHIIGIAKDSYFGLEQHATSSNEEQDVILKKTEDQVPLANQTYLLVGDNGKEKVFDDKSNRFKRQWLAQNKGEHDVAVDLEVLVTPEKEIKYHLYTSAGNEIAHDESDTIKLSFKNIRLNKRTDTYLSIGRTKPFKIELKQDTLGINQSYKLLTNEQGEPPFSIQATDLKTQKAYFFISDSPSYPLENLPSSTYTIVVQDSQEQKAEIPIAELDFSSSKEIQLASSWSLNGREMLDIKPQLKTKEKQLGYRWYLEDKLISTAPVLRVNYPGTFALEITDVRGKSQRFGFTVDRKIQTTTSLDEQWLVSPNPVKAGEEFNVHYLFESDKYVDFYIYTLEGKFIQRNKLGLISGGKYTYRLAGRTTYLLVSIINNKTSIQTLIVK